MSNPYNYENYNRTFISSKWKKIRLVYSLKIISALSAFNMLFTKLLLEWHVLLVRNTNHWKLSLQTKIIHSSHTCCGKSNIYIVVKQKFTRNKVMHCTCYLSNQIEKFDYIYILIKDKYFSTYRIYLIVQIQITI